MSTQALIGKLLPDGRVRYIYLHQDGYFSHAGRILRTFYRTERRLDALLALGNLSGLGPTPYGKDASTDRALDKVRCRAYIRDFGREEKEERAATAADRELFSLQNDIVYLYDRGRWYHIYEGAATDITSPLVVHCDEIYTPDNDFREMDIYTVDGSSQFRKLHDAPSRWSELHELATRQRQTFYLFRKRDNRLIRTVRPIRDERRESIVQQLREWNDTVLETQARPFLAPLGVEIRFSEESFDEDERLDTDTIALYKGDSILEKEILYYIDYERMADCFIQNDDCSPRAYHEQIHLTLFHEIGHALVELFSDCYGQGDKDFDALAENLSGGELPAILKGRKGSDTEERLVETFAASHWEGCPTQSPLHRLYRKYIETNTQNSESHA